MGGSQTVPEGGGDHRRRRAERQTRARRHLQDEHLRADEQTSSRSDRRRLHQDLARRCSGRHPGARLGARTCRSPTTRVEGNGGESGRRHRPRHPVQRADSQNDDVAIKYDHIAGNGSKFSGGIGIFYGATELPGPQRAICSNYSFEYGAGISHYGLSSGGAIADNKIYYNDSFDSGAGIMVSGRGCRRQRGRTRIQQLGPGLGCRRRRPQPHRGQLLRATTAARCTCADALTHRVNLRNNMIVDNGAAHMGGGGEAGRQLERGDHQQHGRLQRDDRHGREPRRPPHGAGADERGQQPALAGTRSGTRQRRALLAAGRALQQHLQREPRVGST